MFGPDVMILGGNHDIRYNKNHMIFNVVENAVCGDIKVEAGAWVGARTLLLSGTCVSEGSVVGAGSLVNHYIPPYVVAVGSPAKKYRRRLEKNEDLMLLLTSVKSAYSIE